MWTTLISLIAAAPLATTLSLRVTIPDQDGPALYHGADAPATARPQVDSDGRRVYLLDCAAADGQKFSLAGYYIHASDAAAGGAPRKECVVRPDGAADWLQGAAGCNLSKNVAFKTAAPAAAHPAVGERLFDATLGQQTLVCIRDDDNVLFEDEQRSCRAFGSCKDPEQGGEVANHAKQMHLEM